MLKYLKLYQVKLCKKYVFLSIKDKKNQHEKMLNMLYISSEL